MVVVVALIAYKVKIRIKAAAILQDADFKEVAFVDPAGLEPATH